MIPSLEETVVLDFITSSSTGAAADADSTPTAAVFEDANDTAILTPTVTKRTSLTGNYRVPVACTAANGFEAGKSYNVIVSATIGGVAAKCKVGTFQVRARDTDDIATLLSVRSNTAQTGGASTITLDASASATDDFYAGLRVLITGGTGAGQERLVYDYDGTTKIVTVDRAWATNPNATSTFALLPAGADVRMMGGGNDATTGLRTVGEDYVQDGRVQSFVAAMDNNVITAAAAAADFVTEVQSGLATAAALAIVDDFIDTEVAAIKAVADKLNTALELDGSVYRFTVNSLELAPSGTGASASAIADEVQTRTIAAVTTVAGLGTGAITEASIATPAETAGRPTGILGMIRRVFEWGSNKRNRDRSTGDVVLRNAADSATLETQTQSTAGDVDTQTKGV